ncbi:glycosyltransferase family 2 protein [Mariniflexile sp. HMF6888]|uniref:glycosyltransferase family 2 protein n=1 Tax=Mariniflexile sp. HMF6888 TaxID=3373086 RepID=UPI00378E8150
MDILIKSFNRVYYLNRCLYSISVHLKNFSGSIYVLDDGTPKIYLDRIQSKYPKIIILKSDDYELKSKLIETQNYQLPNTIPSNLWYKSAVNISDYFIVLEDDMWFTKAIDVANLLTICKKENIALLKLFWVGNKNVIGDVTVKTLSDVILYKPVIQFNNPTVFKYIYAKHNRLWRKLLGVLNLYSSNKEVRYYTIYSVAGAIFKKDYYLSIWKNSKTLVNEKQQLTNAIKYRNENKPNFGRIETEVLKTGFMSSAFLKYKYSEFSIFNFNFTINEHWLKNDLLFCDNLELDLDKNELIKILKLYNKTNRYINEWQNWVDKFKEEYQKIGCNI